MVPGNRFRNSKSNLRRSGFLIIAILPLSFINRLNFEYKWTVIT